MGIILFLLQSRDAQLSTGRQSRLDRLRVDVVRQLVTASNGSGNVSERIRSRLVLEVNIENLADHFDLQLVRHEMLSVKVDFELLRVVAYLRDSIMSLKGPIPKAGVVLNCNTHLVL
ncbi:hypothetical protein PFISCL1PPCAC_14381, partial [Pristionchus fissidentatus]